MTGWQDEQRSHRRFQHRSRKQAGGHGGQFQPRNMLGRYRLRSAFFEQVNTKRSEEQESWLEIHELVESETGYLATFDLGAVSGVMLIAGSRKELRNIVEAAESIEEEDESIEEEEGDIDEDDERDDADSEDTNASDRSKDELDSTSSLSAPEEDRPKHAFEKNTFRTPKWFAQWRGEISSVTSKKTSQQVDSRQEIATESIDEPPEHQEAADDSPAEGCFTTKEPGTHQDNKAHLEFSSAACRDFSATFSCPALQARDVAVQGWKVTGKASPATMTWNGFSPQFTTPV